MLGIRLFIIFILAVANSVDAKTYKWTDEEGRIHFSDRPSSSKAEQIKLKKQPKSSLSTTPNTAQPRITQQRLLNMYQQEREKKKAEKKQRKEEAKKLAQKCADARDYLQRYQRSRLYENLPSGERRYFSEDEHEKTISRLSQNIKRNCK